MVEEEGHMAVVTGEEIAAGAVDVPAAVVAGVAAADAMVDAVVIAVVATAGTVAAEDTNFFRHGFTWIFTDKT